MWMSEEVIASDSKNYRDAMRYTGNELLLVGPARSMKTITGLRKLFAVHFENYGAQSSIVRANSVDLHDTIREDIKWLCRYDFADSRSPIRAEGGNEFHTLHINGGRCTLGGMNRPGRVLGTQKDIILFSQMEESTREQVATLKTRLTGASGKWKDSKGRIISQLVGDANPRRTSHHLLERQSSKRMKFINFTFKDNPIFYHPVTGKQTQAGQKHEETLGELTGHYYDWYYLGKWSDPEGAVFEVPADAISDVFPDLSACMIYNAMDFGMRAPNVCVWIAENIETGEVTVYRDYRKTRQNIISFGDAVRRLRQKHGERVLGTIIDNDENRQQILRDYCRIPTEMSRKGPGSLLDKINMIQEALDKGKLKLYSGMRETRDPGIVRRNLSLDIIDEFDRYAFPETGDVDKPKDKDNDGIDALGYWYLWRSAQRGGLGYYNSKAKRQGNL